MTQLLETWTCLTDYLNIIETHHRNMNNHHQSLDVTRLFYQMNAM